MQPKRIEPFLSVDDYLDGELSSDFIDGLFDPGEDGQVRFLHAPALTTDEMATITEPVRRRVLRSHHYPYLG